LYKVNVSYKFAGLGAIAFLSELDTVQELVEIGTGGVAVKR
jgi:hypothetical protein